MSKNLMMIRVAMAAAGLAAGLALIPTAAASSLTATPNTSTQDASKMSPSEVKALLKSASLPQDHWRLAEYFKAEAAEEDAAAASLESTDTCAEPKSHCSSLVNNAKKASRHAMKMAEEQEKMAEMMLSSSNGGLIHGR